MLFDLSDKTAFHEVSVDLYEVETTDPSETTSWFNSIKLSAPIAVRTFASLETKTA